MLNLPTARTHLHYPSTPQITSLPISLSAMSSTPLPTCQASNSQSPGSSGRVWSAYSWVGTCQVKPGDTTKGTFCIPALPALLGPQKVTIEDQYIASFLKPSIQYAK